MTPRAIDVAFSDICTQLKQLGAIAVTRRDGSLTLYKRPKTPGRRVTCTSHCATPPSALCEKCILVRKA